MIDPCSLISDVPGLIIFNIGDKEFCIDIKNVKAILKSSDLDDFVSDINVNQYLYKFDRSYLLIDLRKLFKSGKKNNGSLLIVCQIFASNIAFIVDNVKEFLTLDLLFLEKAVELFEYEGDQYIRWILKFQERNIYFPDYDKIAKNLDRIYQEINKKTSNNINVLHHSKII